MEKNQQLIVTVLVLVLGLGVGYALGQNPRHAMPGGSFMHGAQHPGMQEGMQSMMLGLQGKTGDDFDQAFLAEMIVHHEGAVQMAEAARQNAKHQELKDMAEDIISAQTAEITQMRAWQQAWYGQ